MPVSLVFIDGLDKGGAGRFKSSATGAFVVTLPFGMEVSEVLPSCEYVDADDADALDCGTIVRAFFFGLEGVAVCVDMTRIGGAATVQRKRGRAETSSLAAWGQRPLGGEYRRRLRIARDVRRRICNPVGEKDKEERCLRVFVIAWLRKKGTCGKACVRGSLPDQHNSDRRESRRCGKLENVT